MGSNAKERKSLAIETNDFECVTWGFFSIELHYCKTAGNLGDRLALSLIFHEIQMTFHGDVCSLVFANQKKNSLVGRFFFFFPSLMALLRNYYLR